MRQIVKYIVILKKILVPFSFLILSFLYVYITARGGALLVGSDRMFHLERMEETYQALCHGHIFSYFSTYSFQRVGQAIGIFYPAGNLVIYAIIHVFIKSEIVSIYAFFLIEQFLRLLIAYYSGLIVLRERKKAYVFAIILSFSAYILNNDFSRFDLGENWALIFVPLTVAGYVLIIKKYYGKGISLLALGLILELYCHILTPIFNALLIVIMFALDYYSLNDRFKAFKALLFSAGLTLIGGLFQIVPMMDLMRSTSIYSPPMSGFGRNLMTLSEFIKVSVNGSIGIVNTGLILIITLIFGWLFYNKETSFFQHLYLVSVILCIASTNLFPWFKLKDTSLSIIQYPWRLVGIAIVLLAFYFSDTFAEHFSRYTTVMLIMLCVLLASFTEINNKETQYSNGQILRSYASANSAWGYLLDNNGIEKVKSRKMPISYSARVKDYLPTYAVNSSDDIFNHNVTVNGQVVPLEQQNLSSGYQKLTYKLPEVPSKKSVLKLPILIYNKQYYSVLLNGKKTNFHRTQNSSLKIIKPNKLKNITISVRFIIPWYWKLVEDLSLVITGLLISYNLLLGINSNIKFKALGENGEN